MNCAYICSKGCLDIAITHPGNARTFPRWPVRSPALASLPRFASAASMILGRINLMVTVAGRSLSFLSPTAAS